MQRPRSTTDSSTFRFLRSESGDVVRMFQRHEHDRNWTPISDYEAYDYFVSIGADLEALDLAYIADVQRQDDRQPRGSRSGASSRRKAAQIVPPLSETVEKSDQADLFAGLDADFIDES